MYDKCPDCGDWKAKKAYRCKHCTPLIREAAERRWKPDATPSAARHRAQVRYPVPETCSRCARSLPIERHHIDDDPYNNKAENIQMLCRRCHMEVDGRLDKLRETVAKNHQKVRDATHCGRGHPFDEENTYIWPVNGQRKCRKCHMLRQRRYKARKREARLTPSDGYAISIPVNSKATKEPELLYRAMVEFLIENGCRREELGSGWWYGDDLPSELGIGEAVEHLLKEKYDLDLRNAVPGEPDREYWG